MIETCARCGLPYAVEQLRDNLCRLCWKALGAGMDRALVEFSLDRDMIDRREDFISPPMDFAITLPVLVNGKHSAIVIYVAASPFDLDTPPNEKAKLVSAVAKALRLAGEEMPESTSTEPDEGQEAAARSQNK